MPYNYTPRCANYQQQIGEAVNERMFLAAVFDLLGMQWNPKIRVAQHGTDTSLRLCFLTTLEDREKTDTKQSHDYEPFYSRCTAPCEPGESQA